MMYRLPFRAVAGLAGADLPALNIPTESEFVAAYCNHTGRDRIERYDFYIAFNMFKLAAIFHGIKRRLARGNAVSPHASDRVKILPELARLAWQQALGAGTA